MRVDDGAGHRRTATAPTRPERFTPALVAGLPEPARRWLCHAIAPGTPLWNSVELEMHGRIRLGRWRPFTAHESITPARCFVWAAQSRMFGLRLGGYDRYQDGAGEMRWHVLGAVPVLSGAGPDVTRSAAGRLAGESVLVPTAFRAATWRAGADPDRVRAGWRIGELELEVELHIDRSGALREVSMLRWGNPGRAPYGLYPFRVVVERERRFAGIRLPSRFRAGWWTADPESAGEFFRAQVTSAAFRVQPPRAASDG